MRAYNNFNKEEESRIGHQEKWTILLRKLQVTLYSKLERFEYNSLIWRRERG